MAGGFILVILFMAIPLALGVILIAKSKPRGLGYPACGRCQYDLSGSVGVASRCPECGSEFMDAGIIPPAGRRNRTMVGVGLALIAIPVSCFGLLAVTATASYQRASVATQRAAQAQAALMQQQTAVAIEQAVASAAELNDEQMNALQSLLAQLADAQLVEAQRGRVGALTRDEAIARITQIISQHCDALAAGSPDATSTTEIRAELQALLDHLQIVEQEH